MAQYLSLEHPSAPTNYDEALSLAGKLNATVTVTDGDGDVATDNVAIGAAISFEDDGPVADIVLVDAAALTLDELHRPAAGQFGRRRRRQRQRRRQRRRQSVPRRLRHPDRPARQRGAGLDGGLQRRRRQ